MFAAAIFAVVTPGITGGLAGLSISYALQVSNQVLAFQKKWIICSLYHNDIIIRSYQYEIFGHFQLVVLYEAGIWAEPVCREHFVLHKT